jgi:hypothetical protein
LSGESISNWNTKYPRKEKRAKYKSRMTKITEKKIQSLQLTLRTSDLLLKKKGKNSIRQQTKCILIKALIKIWRTCLSRTERMTSIVLAKWIQTKAWLTSIKARIKIKKRKSKSQRELKKKRRVKWIRKVKMVIMMKHLSRKNPYLKVMTLKMCRLTNTLLLLLITINRKR